MLVKEKVAIVSTYRLLVRLTTLIIISLLTLTLNTLPAIAQDDDPIPPIDIPLPPGADGDDFDNPPADDSLAELMSRPHLRFSVTLEADSVRPGDIANIQITVINDGETSSEAQTIDLYLDAGVTLIDAENSENIIPITIPPVDPSTTTQITIPLQIGNDVDSDQYISLWTPDVVDTFLRLPIAGTEEQAYLNTPEDPSVWQPRYLKPEIAQFSGAATFGYTFDVPAGRNGLQPNVGLAYNSRNSDGITTDTDSGDVAEGWNLTGLAYISRRDLAPCEKDPLFARISDDDNGFTLNLNGTSHRLYNKDSNDYGQYDAADNAGLYIERLNDLNNNGSTDNITHEYWVVRDLSGTIYRFGHDYDSEQVVVNISGPDPACNGSPPYTGATGNVAVNRWWLDQVTDVHGNILDITYKNDPDYEAGPIPGVTGGSQALCLYPNAPVTANSDTERVCREVSEYPHTIEYNNQVAHVANNYDTVVTLTWSTGSSLCLQCWNADNLITVVGTRRLTAVDSDHKWYDAWRYELETTIAASSSYYDKVTLDSIVKLFPSESASNPTLPPVEFEYTELATGKCVPNPFNHERHYLAVIHNGFGGVYKFNYENDVFNPAQISGWNACDHYNRFVSELHAWDNVEHIYTPTSTTPTVKQKIIYDPNDACFSYVGIGHYTYGGSGTYTTACGGSNATGFRLVGFQKATMQIMDGNNNVEHVTASEFYINNNDLFIGKPQHQHQYAISDTIPLTATPLVSTTTERVYDDDNNSAHCPSTGLAAPITCISKQITRQHDRATGEELVTWIASKQAPEHQSASGSRQYGVVTRQTQMHLDTAVSTQIGDCHHDHQWPQQHCQRDLIQTTAYTTNTNKWVLVPWGQGVYTNHPSGTGWQLLNTTLNFYDNPAILDADSQTIDNGQLTYSRSLLANTATGTGIISFDSIDTAYTYDTNSDGDGYHFPGLLEFTTTYADYGTVSYNENGGNPYWVATTANGSTTRTSEIRYTSEGLRIDWVENALGHQTDLDYNVGGRPWLLTDIGDPNGAWRQFSYDTADRLLWVKQPHKNTGAATFKAVEYTYTEWTPPGATEPSLQIDTVIAPHASALKQTQRVFYDGLGRVIQQRSLDVEVTNGLPHVWSDIEYDALGRTICQTSAINGNSSSYQIKDCDASTHPHTATTYDDLGRVSTVTTPDGEQVQHDYGIFRNPWSTTGVFALHSVVDANDHALNHVYDAVGKLVHVLEFTGTDPYQLYATTTYTYDKVGQLLAVEDEAGNTTTMDYDGLGRKLSMDDPDMGVWDYEYDPAGNLVAQSDNGDWLCFVYDDLNRLTQKSSTTATSCSGIGFGTTLATYTYDGGSNQNGYLTFLDDLAGDHSWSYDRRGRVTSETRDIGTQSFTMAYTYDNLDRIKTMTYPDNEVVTTTYNQQGQPEGLSGNRNSVLTTYVEDATYNVMGQMKQIELGNTLSTWFGYHGYEAFGSDDLFDSQINDAESFGRLYRICTSKTNSASDCHAGPISVNQQRLDLRYEYDPVGNVTKITDALNSVQVQTFAYDHLNRLVSAETNSVGNGQYDRTYEYDELGNILHRKDWNGPTLIDDWEYEYNGAQPHAVTDIDTSSTNYDFTYDVRGNMTDRDDDTGDFEQEFDVENRLIEVKEGTSTTTFTYDANGQRMQTVRPDGTTIYTPFPMYEKEVLGGDTTIRSTYMLGGQAVAVRVVETGSNNRPLAKVTSKRETCCRERQSD